MDKMIRPEQFLPSSQVNCTDSTTTSPDQYYTFNRLLEIQLLIKKESGLKELCKIIKIVNKNIILIYSLQRQK
jgi:hypothetical protein